MPEVCFGSCRASGALVQRRPRRGTSLPHLLGPSPRRGVARRVRPRGIASHPHASPIRKEKP